MCDDMTMNDLFRRAVAAHRECDYETAIEGYSALRAFKMALHNLGVVYGTVGRLAEAEEAWQTVLLQYPDFPHSRFSLAMLLLSQARYEEGWRHYEARRHDGLTTTLFPETSAPEWMGEDLSGRRIAVCAEQGYGDQIMFGRYLPALSARGAEIVVCCDAAMRPLFERAGYASELYTPQHRAIPTVDFWTLLGSLPLRLEAYEIPPPLELNTRARGGAGVGVVPSGNPRHKNDHHRSLPPETAHNLLKFGRDLRPEATGARDFLETAEIIASLDLVITVDTAIAHLSATLGVPTWILVPAHGADWRWLRDRTDSPWYPTVRLFRQGRPTAWDEVLEKVRDAL